MDTHILKYLRFKKIKNKHCLIFQNFEEKLAKKTKVLMVMDTHI